MKHEHKFSTAEGNVDVEIMTLETVLAGNVLKFKDAMEVAENQSTCEMMLEKFQR